MMDAKPAYEPVNTEDVAADNESAPIVETTPPDVAEKNEKNAEATKSATEVEKDASKEVELNGNVALDLDSSIVPLKEAEELPDQDEEKQNGHAKGENGMVSIEIQPEEMTIDDGKDDEDLRTKRTFSCPKCPSLPAWRPIEWSPNSHRADDDVSDTVAHVESLFNSEKFKWLTVTSFLFFIICIIVVIYGMNRFLSRPSLTLHLRRDCPGNDLAPVTFADVNSTAVFNATAAAPTAAPTAAAQEMKTLTECAEACMATEACVGASYRESEEVCVLKTSCAENVEVEGSLLIIKD